MIGQTNCKKKGVGDIHLTLRNSPFFVLTRVSAACVYLWQFCYKLDLTIGNGIHVRGVTDPQEQIPMALSPRLIFCPSDTRNCPSFTASPTFCNVYLHCQQKIVCLCGSKIFGLLAPSVIGYKDWGDMLWVCPRLSAQTLTSFMTPVFVPPDRTQAFVALAAPIRPAFND